MKLSDHKILITGGNKGIGLALAKRFVILGNRVIVTGRNPIDLKQAKQDVPGLITCSCDLTVSEDVERLVRWIQQEHADLNVLVNNAGVQYNYKFATASEIDDKIVKEITTNFLAPIQLTAALLPTLRQNATPAIVNVSSGLALVPKQSAPVYCGTKAGLHIFTKALRYQLPGIRVFEIIPPLVDTAMTRGRGRGKLSPEQLVDEFIRAFRKDKHEINIGKVKLLRWINRVSPSLADKIMRNG